MWKILVLFVCVQTVCSRGIIKYYAACPDGFTGQLPYVYDCRSFLNCAEGRTYIQRCGVQTRFNPGTLVCDHMHNVKCEIDDEVVLQAIRESTSPGYFNENVYKIDENNLSCDWDASGLYAHPYECSKFLRCWNGKTYIEDCPPGTIFDDELSVCDHKQNVRRTGCIEAQSDDATDPTVCDIILF